MEGFIYPNEAVLEWDLLIVIYPFITGLVAGAFIVSSLYHVFGLNSLKPVARFSLVTALAFLLVTPLPLVIHLGRPERALEMLLRPNLLSAMAMFGYIWMAYLLLLLGEVWLVFRSDLIEYAHHSKGIKKTIYSVLCLGVYDIYEEAAATDRKLVKYLAVIGVPLACLLHGYVGFIFGAIKANPWWSTPLMPFIFLVSAIVSGIALLIVLYVVVSKIRKAAIDYNCEHSLVLWLGGFLTLALALEGLEVLSRLYESEETWEILSLLITQKLVVSYLGIQYILGILLPLLLLAIMEFARLSQRVKTSWRFISALFILIGIFAMRWNVVIGGQLVSKSMRGFTSFTPEFWGQGGILVTGIILSLPFIILAVISYLIPPWQEGAKLAGQRPIKIYGYQHK